MARLDKRRIGVEILKMRASVELNQSQASNQWFTDFSGTPLMLADSPPLAPILTGNADSLGAGNDVQRRIYCVFATRGGVAVVMNWVASSIAVPSGVGITIRNGTRMRVPATGAKAISMLRWAARYLITGRSGI